MSYYKKKSNNTDDLATELKNKGVEQTKVAVTDKIKQSVKQTIFTDQEVKIQRASNKLDKKIDSLEAKNQSVEAMITNEKKQSSLKKTDDKTDFASYSEPRSSPRINSNDKKIIQSKVEFEKSNSKLESRNTDQHISKSSEKVDFTEDRVSKNVDKKQQKLEKKVEKYQGKVTTEKAKVEQLTKSRVDLGNKISDSTKKVESKTKSPFSSKTVGKRTVPAKLVKSPFVASSKAGGALKDSFNRDIEQSDIEGVKIANTALSKSATALRKSSLKLVSNTIGFDRKAQKILKLEKAENKLKKQTASSIKKQVKNNRKQLRKLHASNKAASSGLVNNIKQTMKQFMSNTKAGIVGFGKKKGLAFAGGGMILFLSLGVVIMPIGALIMSGTAMAQNEKVIVYDEADIHINLDSISYQATNPYTSAGYRGQCTWYVWGRVHELYEKRLPTSMGNGGKWADSVRDNPLFSVHQEPKTHSIMVLQGSTFGHVAFVESYDPETGIMIVSEGNVSNPYAGTDRMVEEARLNYAEYFRLNTSVEYTGENQVWRSLTIVGYIYLDDFVKGE